MPVLSEDGALPTQETEWKCSNQLAKLNLGERSCTVPYLEPNMHVLYFDPTDTFTWEGVPDFPSDSEESSPCPRAGHSAAVVGTRMYVWSGRDGYRRVWNNQVWKPTSSPED